MYLAGAALTVALSFAFVMLADVRAEPPAPAGPGRVPPAWLRYGLRAIGLIGWTWIVVQGILGGQSAGDVKTLFLLGLRLGRRRDGVGPALPDLALAGSVRDDPRHRREGGTGGRHPGLGDGRLSRAGWGAGRRSSGCVFFVWLELVGAVSGTRMLFIVLVGYTAFTLAMMAQFGRDAWRRDGETFSVWFGLLEPARAVRRSIATRTPSDAGRSRRACWAAAGRRSTSRSSASAPGRSCSTGCPRRRRGSASSARRTCRSRRSSCWRSLG